MIKKILTFAFLHKFLAAFYILILSGGFYYGYKYFYGGAVQTRYVTAKAEKGTLIVSVSGSGQVAVSDQVDVKSKVSGDVVYIGVKNGNFLEKGALIARIDSADAERTIRDAEISLESAKLSFEKFKLANSQEKITADLKKAYDDGFNSVSNTFLDLPGVMLGLQRVLFDSNLSASQQNYNFYADSVKTYDERANKYRDDAYNSYQAARKAYDQAFAEYKSASRFSEDAVVEELISKAYDTTKSIAEAVKNANDLIQFYQDKLTERGVKPNAFSVTHIASLNTYTGQTNSHLSNLLSILQTVKNSKNAFINIDLDLKSQEISLQQRKTALSDAKEKLADYFIRAPIDGVATNVAVKNGNSASAGTAIATIIARQKIAEILLNEVDVAKVKIGEKTNLTFDAVAGLTITGEIAEVDVLGAVSQGVVSYGVKIAFDTQDDRIKPGMSVSVAIITGVKQDVLTVPNAAIKSEGTQTYIEVLENGAPVKKEVAEGLSSDTITEITDGINEGDEVITQTITQTAAQAQTPQVGGLRIPGITGGGGGGGAPKR